MAQDIYHKAKGIIALEITCVNCSAKFFIHSDKMEDHLFLDCPVCKFQAGVEVEPMK